MYDTILVPTDGSEVAGEAASHAMSLADTYDAEVHGLFVADTRMKAISSELTGADAEDVLFDDDHHPADAFEERARSRDVPLTAATRVGLPYEEIVDYADEVDADMIAMGTHGRTGLSRFLIGSTTERVLRTASVPVLAVHGSE